MYGSGWEREKQGDERQKRIRKSRERETQPEMKREFRRDNEREKEGRGDT